MFPFVAIIGVIVILFLALNVMSEHRPTQSSGNGFIDALASAIARAENVDATANNPGALTSGDVPSGNIAGTFNDAGVVIVDSIENGWNALFSKLQNIFSGNSSVYSPDMTISEFAQTYTGGNNSDTWAQSVASDLGVTPDTTLADAEANYGQ